MNREKASQLIHTYIRAWEQQDLDLALSVLDPDLVIVENDGMVYCGTDEFRAWFAEWHAPPNFGRVLRWQISRVLFDETLGQAAVEWDFECSFEGRVYVFPGASLLEFDSNRITRIQEYRMDKDQHRPYGAQT